MNHFTKGSEKNEFEPLARMIFKMSNVIFVSTQHNSLDMDDKHVMLS